MQVKKVKLYCVILTLLFILSSCSSAADVSDNTNDSTDSSETVSEEMKVAITAQPPTLDTHMSTAGMAEVIGRNIYESLLAHNSDFQPIPMLAEAIEESEDGKSYTFPLRKGIKFHNGEEMTAEDVIASMNRWKENSIGGKLIGNATFEEKDPYTVILELEEPMVDVLDIIADHAQISAIMPKEVIESAGSDEVSEYIGTGPFKFVEWKQDQHIHLAKFEDYKPVDLPADGYSGKKEALVNDIYFKIVPDSSTRVAGLQTGEYDITNEILYDDYERLKNDPNVHPHPSLHGNMFVIYNKIQGLSSDLTFRKAVNAVLDTDSIMKAAYAHEDLYSLDAGYMKERKDWYSEEGKEEYNQNDPEKAKQLLKEAGYNGEVVKILVSSDYQHHYNTAVVVKEQLDQIGMNTELEIYDWPTTVEQSKDPSKWDLWLVSSAIPSTPSSLNILSPDYQGGVENDTVSQLLDEMQKSSNKVEAKKHWDELQGYLWTDFLPVSILGQYNKSPVISDKVEGFSEFKGGILWNTKVVE